MTVKELQRFLLICEPDAEVLIDYGDGQIEMEGVHAVTEILAGYQTDENGAELGGIRKVVLGFVLG